MTNPPPLNDDLSQAALAFRGYNVENLGRTAELLATPRYADTVAKRLGEASDVCAEVVGRPVDLEARVRSGEEASLGEYAESVALVFAVELAQIDLLKDEHGVPIDDARMSLGYSLGELVALVVSSVLHAEEVLRVPLAMAADCAALARDVTMGVLFSRGPGIEEASVRRVCDDITAEGRGTIAISAVLSPNTYLVLGQAATTKRLRAVLRDAFGTGVHLRQNESRWPPLHTPLVRQRKVPDRASVMMETFRINNETPRPPVFSLVTGRWAGEAEPLRDTLRRWVDHPQRLWDGIVAVLAADVRTVVHVGPRPNVIPATFRRLSDNVRHQTSTDAWAWAARGAQRTWLSALLPKSASLLRAPDLRHVVLEDWLLENA